MNRREDGFTLIELLVTISILGVIVGALAASLIVGLRHTADTQQRLADSHDAQLVTAYFVPDVQSAQAFTLATPACLGAAPVIRMTWTDEGATAGAGDDVAKTACYIVSSTADGTQLTRVTFNGSTQNDSIVVAHALDPANPVTVVCATASGVTSPCAAAAAPDKVTLTVNAKTSYSFSVSATRRPL